MVTGLDRFVEYFRGMEESYVLIGGAACDHWMGTFDLPFRATQDLDIVLVIETLDERFIERFWEFVEKADYRSQHATEGAPALFRFHDPQSDGYPLTIELFCRQPFDLPEGTRIAPFHAGDDQPSLSVILMDADYYKLVTERRVVVEAVPMIPASCLIPLKAKAFLNLTEQREADKRSVQSGHIRKHRNDVFRLLLTLAPGERVDLSGLIKNDMRAFLDALPPGSKAWKDIRKSVNDPTLSDDEEVIGLLKAIFQL